MKLKRFVSEPVIIGFVVLVDLASVIAIVLCHQDVTKKEAQAAVEVEVHEAVSAKTPPPAAEMTNYSPSAINSLLRPQTDPKFLHVSRRISTPEEK